MQRMHECNKGTGGISIVNQKSHAEIMGKLEYSHGLKLLSLS